jgi:hypothetical protein
MGAGEADDAGADHYDLRSIGVHEACSSTGTDRRAQPRCARMSRDPVK